MCRTKAQDKPSKGKNSLSNFHEETLTKMRRHIFRNPKKDIMQDVKLRDSMIEKGGVSI